MTAVIEIPDELYQKVMARVALLGRQVPDITVELYENWLGDEGNVGAGVAPQAERREWLEEWFRDADAAILKADAGLTARELLTEGRNRLEGA